MTAKGLTPISFATRIDGVTSSARSFSDDGSPLSWCVRRADGAVLAKDGEWEYEPLPSSRDDEFIARTRWPTARTAAAFVYEHQGER